MTQTTRSMKEKVNISGGKLISFYNIFNSLLIVAQFCLFIISCTTFLHKARFKWLSWLLIQLFHLSKSVIYNIILTTAVIQFSSVSIYSLGKKIQTLPLSCCPVLPIAYTHEQLRDIWNLYAAEIKIKYSN